MSRERISEEISDDALDGRTLGTRPEAYVYFRDSEGRIVEARIVCAWHRLIRGDDWQRLYRLDRSVRELLERGLGP